MGSCCSQSCCVGACCHVEEPPSPPIPQGMIRICCAGGGIANNPGGAHKLVAEITRAHPDKYESWYYFTTMGGYYQWSTKRTENVKFPDHLKGHDTMPLVWLEETEEARKKDEWTVLGGKQELADWAKKTFPASDPRNARIHELANSHTYMLGMIDRFRGGCCCAFENDSSDPHMASTCFRDDPNSFYAKNSAKKNKEGTTGQPLINNKN